MPPTEHTQFPTIERPQDSDSPKQSLDTSSDVERQSTSRNESSLTLGQTTQLPENISQLKELESLEANTDLPLFDAVKTQDLISQDRPPALEPDRLTADEIQRITENIEAFLDTRGVSFEQIVHDPEFVHSLSSMGLAQMERVVLLGKIATSLDNTLSEDRTIDSHRFEKTDDHVFRLCINQLRDFARCANFGNKPGTKRDPQPRMGKIIYSPRNPQAMGSQEEFRMSQNQLLVKSKHLLDHYSTYPRATSR
jgi:hypothetical protein